MMRHPLAIGDRSLRGIVPLVVGIGLAVVVLLLPARWTTPVKQATLALLQPGQRAAASVRYQTSQWIEGVRNHINTAAKLRTAQGELTRLQSENRRLTDQLTQVKHNNVASTAQAEPLLQARSIPANVLGHQARAFLARHELLDVGAAAGAEADSLVLDAASALVDRGSDDAVKPGRFVLSGGRIWGKVLEVGAQISLVQTITAAGYRDLVRLGSEGVSRAGPQGILEGTGEPLARIRFIEVTEPVAVGDVVWAAESPGARSSKPLLYGRVVRVERAAGATHWDIWMKPAVDSNRVKEVFIVQPELNPQHNNP